MPIFIAAALVILGYTAKDWLDLIYIVIPSLLLAITVYEDIKEKI